MLGRFRSAIYSAIGTIEVEPGTPVPGVAGSGDNVRIGKVSLKLLSDIDYYQKNRAIIITTKSFHLFPSLVLMAPLAR